MPDPTTHPAPATAPPNTRPAARCVYCDKGPEAGQLAPVSDRFEPAGPGLTHEACESAAYADLYSGPAHDQALAEGVDPPAWAACERSCCDLVRAADRGGAS